MQEMGSLERHKFAQMLMPLSELCKKSGREGEGARKVFVFVSERLAEVHSLVSFLALNSEDQMALMQEAFEAQDEVTETSLEYVDLLQVHNLLPRTEDGTKTNW